MSKADKMFDELGYKKYEIDAIVEYITEDISNKIVFYKNQKEYSKLYTFETTMQELQAINEKCKELGWI